jgi:hypothetical protein
MTNDDGDGDDDSTGRQHGAGGRSGTTGSPLYSKPTAPRAVPTWRAPRPCRRHAILQAGAGQGGKKPRPPVLFRACRRGSRGFPVRYCGVGQGRALTWAQAEAGQGVRRHNYGVFLCMAAREL